MSTELAVTAVTATLVKLLEDEVADKWGTTVLSGDLTQNRLITTLPPHKVRELHPADNIINLFLYRADVNAAWRNMTPPAQGKPGDAAVPPLALNLEYLISAYGEDEREEVAHFFLGQAMRVLHDIAIVPRKNLFDVLKAARVHDQIDRITISPRALSIEEISKLWSVFQTQYRVSSAYLVTVVLIDSKVTARAALPVLTRGPGDQGVSAVAAAAAVLDFARPATGYSAVRLGEDLVVSGERLDTAGITATVRHRFMPQAQAVAVSPISARELRVTIPAAASAPGIAKTWPAGMYSLSLTVARPNQPPWTTNDVGFMLAPSITVAPKTVQPPIATFELTAQAIPQVHPSQTVSIFLDDVPFAPKQPIAAPANADAPTILKVDLPGTVQGFHRVRVRVDGIDSIPITRVGDRPQFDVNQSVEVKP